VRERGLSVIIKRMDPKDPRSLSDEDLERRLREEGFRRYDCDLIVSRADSGTWSADFKSYGGISELAPEGITRHGIEGGDSRRHVLEQLWLSLDVEDDLADYRAGKMPDG
jgi:hypothetical protein